MKYPSSDSPSETLYNQPHFVLLFILASSHVMSAFLSFLISEIVWPKQKTSTSTKVPCTERTSCVVTLHNLRKKLLFLHWLLLLYGRLRRSWFMFCSLHFTECQKYQPNPRKLVGNTWKEESVKSVQFSEIFYTSILSFLFEENVRNSSRLEFLKRFSNVRFFYLTTHIHS